MTTMLRYAAIVIMAGFLAGCAGHSQLQRGWMGGELENARSGWLKPDPFQGDTTIPVLPESVRQAQSGAVLVVRLDGETPLGAAGIVPGDLITRVDGVSVTDAADLREKIDRVAPGTTVQLSIYRKGSELQREVVVGRETYRKIGTLSIGLRFSPEIDLKASTNFSLFSLLSFHNNDKRKNLNSPDVAYLSDLSKPVPAENPLWEVWLGIVGVGRHESILKQETVKVANGKI
ncbi:PDZ domain-containing protein [Geomesophilobacter sediminis]|uniref:PDZ domain-containing protein n=1 Tax=Geomesophilobacter sediminis TaxID=2798584 RepID=A0A8J7IY03_9BACT|nr:PDZ domain-containing protein [Geomesophilobacter sediminis]MBJ6724937.1 PDZ domain-containing protein [Geomesophilobacter sediminis]